ncbi:MAG: YncE family protein [Candidatus Sulfotelmatobacter sp.]
MSFRRVGRLAAILLPILLWLGCGQIYRPVVIPCSEGGIPGCPVETPPIPANFHTVFAISANAPGYPGGAMQIDVAGDTIIGETPTEDESEPNLGDNPTHAAIVPNNSEVFVASAGSVVPGGLDLVSYFTPAFQSSTATGLGEVLTIALPTGSQPVFLDTTQNNVMYVANFGTNSVSAVNPTTDSVSNTGPAGTNPVALAELGTGLKLYVANQGSDSVSSLNTADLSSNPVTGFSGMTPVWVVARGDSQKVYVLTQGDGQLVTIDTATDTVTSSLPVGAGANFMFFDPNLNRLYVTNPVTRMVYVFSDTGGANDTPSQLAAISFAAGSVPCPAGCSPASVTALHDGSRFYVASYRVAASCPDAFVGAASACVIPGLTVFDANSFAPKYPKAPTLSLLTYPPFAANLTTNQYQYAVPTVASCAPPAPPAVYTPRTTRFRVFTTAAVDSSRVYVSLCDAGVIAVINTTGNNTNNSGDSGVPADTVVTDLPAAFGVCAQSSCSSVVHVTGFSITSNVVTFQAANQFEAGQSLSISGLKAGTYLNGVTLTVLATGLSGSQFECYFTYANVGPTSDSGTAIPEAPSQSPVFMLSGQ